MDSTKQNQHPFIQKLTLVVVVFAIGSNSYAQTPLAASPALPALSPSAANPPSANPLPVTPPSPEAAIEDRFRKMEERFQEMDRRHNEEYQALSDKYQKLQNRLESEGNGSGRGVEGINRRTESGSVGANRPSGSPTGPNARERSGIDAQGADGRTFVREAASSSKNKSPVKVQFDEGIEFSSEDDEFKLNFHNLTQAEFRSFPSQDLGTLKDQFFIPRQRWYFTGQATKNVEFYTVINRGYGSLDLLDAFMTLNISQSLTNTSAEQLGTGAQGSGGRTTVDRARGTDPRLRLRIGRMKTPYLYEYFSIAEGDLIAPERSLYAGNFAANRQVGAMFLGDIFKDSVGYAAGIFNGPRRSFGDTNSDKDLFFYLNTRPFLHSESLSALKYLNLGGSVNGGYENNPTQPSVLTTANDETTTNAVAATLSPAFLTFNQNAIEVGKRVQYSAHLAYFYKSFMLLGEYGGGTIGYGLSNKAHSSTQVPLEGYMVQASYFLTGEQLTRRVNVVRPLHDFGYKDGKFGFGAVEVHARFSELNLGKQVFTSGFADPNLWSNRASTTDIGANWYLNYYTKIYFDWQHAFYGNKITTGIPNRYMSSTDLFWLRFQVFF